MNKLKAMKHEIVLPFTMEHDWFIKRLKERKPFHILPTEIMDFKHGETGQNIFDFISNTSSKVRQ
jgi:hypothetical protein